VLARWSTLSSRVAVAVAAILLVAAVQAVLELAPD
jgi:hypothetical protein